MVDIQPQVRNEMKQELQISTINPLLLAFQKYLDLNYSSPKTRYLYEKKAISFLNSVYQKTKIEPRELTQAIIDEYLIELNKSRVQNPFYTSFIKAFRIALDPDSKLKLKTRTDRSHSRKTLEEYDWFDIKDLDTLIEKGSPLISLLVRIYKDTGRRLTEVQKIDLNSKEWDLDLVGCHIKGLAKGNVEFKSHFSKETAKAIFEFMKSPLCKNPSMPFMIYKNSGELYGNPSSALLYEFKKQCRYLGLKTVKGNSGKIHAIRHTVGRYLSQDKKFTLPEVALKLGHSNINNTKKYTTPSIQELDKKEDSEIFNK